MATTMRGFRSRTASSARRRRERGSRHPLVAVIGSDPYLAFLVRQQLPDVELVEARVEGAGEVLARAPRIVFLAEDVALPPGIDRASIVYVVEPHDIPDGVEPDRVLVRPYLPSEVERVLRPVARVQSRPGSKDIIARTRPLLAAARVLAAILAFVLTRTYVGAAEQARVRPILIATVAYALGRIFVRIGGRTASILDATAGAAILAFAQTSVAAFLPMSFVLGVAAATEARSWRGVGWGVAVASGLIPEVVHRASDVSLNATDLAPWMGLFILGALAAGLGGRATRDTRGMQALSEANRLLSMLYGVARTMPDGFDAGSISSTLMTEIRDRLGAPAAALVTDEFGNATIAGSFGCPDADAIVGSREVRHLRALATGGGGNFTPAELPERVVHGVGGSCFFVVPIRRKTRMLGVLVTSCERHVNHTATSMFLRELGSEAALAFENAHLFGAVGDMSVDQERRRLGRELHDGVAQVLTHLRFELDMIAKKPPPPEELQHEMTRLGGVLQDATADVRRMIHGLRSPATARGLAGAIRVYLRDIAQPGGPELSFSFAGEERAGQDVEAEAFRIAQEAVWNAVRHAHAKRIDVVLSIGTDSLALIVEDDGIGFDGYSIGNRHGVDSMRERATRIGGRLSIGRRAGGGTRVELTCPLPGEPA